MQLSVAHVNRKDVGRAALQEAVGEAAGGSAHVQAGLTRNRQGEMVQGAGQLEAATADVREASPHFQGYVFCQGRTGLEDPSGRGKNQSLHNEDLGLLPAIGQASFSQQDIGAFFS